MPFSSSVLFLLSSDALEYASPFPSLHPFIYPLLYLCPRCFFLNALAKGTDVSIVTFSKMVGTALEAAEVLTAKGISAEVRKCPSIFISSVNIFFFLFPFCFSSSYFLDCSAFPMFSPLLVTWYVLILRYLMSLSSFFSSFSFSCSFCSFVSWVSYRYVFVCSSL